MIRLTKRVREQLLRQNEGRQFTTSSSGKNFSEDRTYTIRGGQLHIRASGKGAWADSRYSGPEWVADERETHQFLYNHLPMLNTDGLE